MTPREGSGPPRPGSRGADLLWVGETPARRPRGDGPPQTAASGAARALPDPSWAISTPPSGTWASGRMPSASPTAMGPSPVLWDFGLLPRGRTCQGRCCSCQPLGLPRPRGTRARLIRPLPGPPHSPLPMGAPACMQPALFFRAGLSVVHLGSTAHPCQAPSCGLAGEMGWGHPRALPACGQACVLWGLSAETPPCPGQPGG